MTLTCFLPLISYQDNHHFHDHYHHLFNIVIWSKNDCSFFPQWWRLSHMAPISTHLNIKMSSHFYIIVNIAITQILPLNKARGEIPLLKIRLQYSLKKVHLKVLHGNNKQTKVLLPVTWTADFKSVCASCWKIRSRVSAGSLHLSSPILTQTIQYFRILEMECGASPPCFTLVNWILIERSYFPKVGFNYVWITQLILN